MNDLSDLHTSISHATMDSSMSDVHRILDGVQHHNQHQHQPYLQSTHTHTHTRTSGGAGAGAGGGAGGSGGDGSYQPPVPEDEEDFRVLRYGCNCVLKSRQVWC